MKRGHKNTIECTKHWELNNKKEERMDNNISKMTTNRILRISCDSIPNGRRSKGRPRKDGRTFIERFNRFKRTMKREDKKKK